MSPEEFCYWKAYFQINPFGNIRDDIRIACLASDIINYLGGNTTPKKFLRKFGKKVNKRKEWERKQRALRNTLMAYAAAQNEFVEQEHGGKNKHKDVRRQRTRGKV
jgi:hypothetical protein